MHENILHLVSDRDGAGINSLLGQMSPVEAAMAVLSLPEAERVIALELLEPETAVTILDSLASQVVDNPGIISARRLMLAPGLVTVLLSDRRFIPLRELLNDQDPVDVAHLLRDLPVDQAVLAFRLLSKDMAVDVFEHMDTERQQSLLEAFNDERVRSLVSAMSPDDRTRLLDEVPANVTNRLLRLLPPDEREAAATLLGYPEDSAGRVMTPDFVRLTADSTVGQALERIRKQALDKETIYYCYVTDSGRRLLGTVSLKDLLLARPEFFVGEIMRPGPRSVTTLTDQEDVAHILRQYDLLAVPVVDVEDRLVGIVTYDDVLDILHYEATEDIYRYGAVPVSERAYFGENTFTRSRRRIVWLFFLVLVNTITGTIIAGQSDLLGEVQILAAFIPLLIGTGGNIGSQSSTVVVRGLATGELKGGQAARTMVGELGVGALLAAGLGSLTFVWALALTGGEVDVAIVIGVTLALIATFAAVVGGGLPFLFRVAKVDPAAASAPLVTTVMDVSGVVIYFGIATVLLRL